MTAVDRLAAFCDLWIERGYENIVAGLGVHLDTRLTVEDVRAVLAEVEELTAENERHRRAVGNSSIASRYKKQRNKASTQLAEATELLSRCLEHAASIGDTTIRPIAAFYKDVENWLRRDEKEAK